MGKIFRVTGCYSYNNKTVVRKRDTIELDENMWAKPDPCFSGLISIHDTSFYGYVKSLPAREIPNETYLLSGIIICNPYVGGYGIAFYKISNDPNSYPELHVIPNLGSIEGSYWKQYGLFHWLASPNGKTKVKLEAINMQDETMIVNIASGINTENIIIKKILDNTNYLDYCLKQAFETKRQLHSNQNHPR